ARTLSVFYLSSICSFVFSQIPIKGQNKKNPGSSSKMRSRNSSAVFWHGGSSGGYQTLLLDEDRGWLLVGGRDHVYMLQAESLTQPMRKIHWPAGKEHTERCRHAGKNLSTDCANFVRLLQPFNKTHVYVCGTGAYHPQCTYIYLGHSVEEPAFTLLTHTVESGRGKCPFSPHESFTAQLTDGELYAGTSVDFMGNNAAIFRTSVHTSSQHYIRTEAYHDYWLNEPDFVGSYFIPDTHSLDDDKVYFFFKETAVESNQQDKRVYSRVARVCKNDIGGKRSLINRWSTFLKARLVCSVPGPGGMDTHFDELEDIFLLETKDPQNPVIYGVFSTSSSVFRGSAVCVYSMASIRAAFNGPFAHKEGPDYRWVEYKEKIPYPRPGTVSVHLWNSMIPNVSFMGVQYDRGILYVVKWVEVEDALAHILVFPFDGEVAQLPLQRCELYGKACADCCLARDPYCAWNGSTCSSYFPSNKRRARRQDVRYGDPWSQCQDLGEGFEDVELKTVYAVESNSTFLECTPRSPQAAAKWVMQQSHTQTTREDNIIHTGRGLLLQHITSLDAGLYLCTTHERSFSRTVARYDLRVIAEPNALTSRPPTNHAASPLSYKELNLIGVSGLTADEYCEQLWYREKRRQQKLRALKWKQTSENRKARVRRQNPPDALLQ
uniref:Si:dkey-49n23.1 n=1 Tax=Astyanax mexicanus TaxID=7994 RepID=A0A8B9KSL0_ASTMX